MSYEESFVRAGDGRGYARHSGEAWNALADFAKKFMEENEDIRSELEQKLRDAMAGKNQEEDDVDISDLPGVQEMDPDLAAMLNHGLDNPIQ